MDAGAKDDGPKYFRNGLRELQAKLEDRVYVHMAPFCADLVQVFTHAITTAEEDQVMLEDGSAPVALSAKQKDIKKVAKRIIKSIKDKVAEAQRAETGLSGRQMSSELINLDAMLESNLRIRHGSVLHSVDGSLMTDGEPGSPLATRLVNGHSGFGSDSKDKAGEGIDKDETTDDAIIRLQLVPGAETIPIINTGDANGTSKQHNGEGGSSTSSTATAPALSASGSTNPSMHPPEPFTPPDHHPEADGAGNDIRESVEGGIPWYAEAFSPRGTTIYEERWGGREIIRSMSEDLSELGEDDLVNLLDADAGQSVVVTTNGNLAPPETMDETRRKALERKKQMARRRRKLGWGG